jgi:hypothetical protein
MLWATGLEDRKKRVDSPKLSTEGCRLSRPWSDSPCTVATRLREENTSVDILQQPTFHSRVQSCTTSTLCHVPLCATCSPPVATRAFVWLLVQTLVPVCFLNLSEAHISLAKSVLTCGRFAGVPAEPA